MDYELRLIVEKVAVSTLACNHCMRASTVGILKLTPVAWVP